MSNNSKSTDTGLVSVSSQHSVAETANRLEAVLQEKGLKTAARINHAAAAAVVGETLRPTELVLFGNPKAGTPLMQSQQTIAIDLPQKMLVWEDESGAVWLTYNNPAYLAGRHTITGCDELISATANGLAAIAEAAAS